MERGVREYDRTPEATIGSFDVERELDLARYEREIAESKLGLLTERIEILEGIERASGAGAVDASEYAYADEQTSESQEVGEYHESEADETVDYDYSGLDRDFEDQILESPEEKQRAWVESSGEGATESEYIQQSLWVIGQFGRMIDCTRDSITTDAQAIEWLEMKKTIEAAKTITDFSAMAGIRSQMIPIWAEYVTRMQFDMAKFNSVANT